MDGYGTGCSREERFLVFLLPVSVRFFEPPVDEACHREENGGEGVEANGQGSESLRQ